MVNTRTRTDAGDVPTAFAAAAFELPSAANAPTETTEPAVTRFEASTDRFAPAVDAPAVLATGNVTVVSEAAGHTGVGSAGWNFSTGGAATLASGLDGTDFWLPEGAAANAGNGIAVTPTDATAPTVSTALSA